MTHAFIRLYSNVLGEEITILLDPLALDAAKATKNLVYREQEVEILSKIELAEETLQTIHKLKKFFRGWIVSCDMPKTEEQSE